MYNTTLLETLLRNAAKRGELSHLSVIPKGKGFEAVYTQASRAAGQFYATDADPVTAITKALQQMTRPKKPVEDNKEDFG